MIEPSAALEITSSGIKLVVGYVNQEKVYVLDALESDQAKLVQGQISDAEEMSHAIKELVMEAEKTLGRKIPSVLLGMPSTDLTVTQVKKQVITSDQAANPKVTLFDGSNCIGMIKREWKDPNKSRVILDIVPYQYLLDSNAVSARFPQNQISTAITIFADLESMDGLVVKSFSAPVNAAGLRIDMLINTANASVKYISSFQKSFSEYVYLDIGAKTTTLGYAYDNRLMNAEVLPFGSENLTEELQRKFGLSHQKAEEYKKLYGISEDPPFEFRTPEGLKVSEIGNALKQALTPLTDKISGFMLSIDSTARNLFIVTGGGADLFGLDTFLTKAFQNRVMMFTPTCYGARSKVYTNCVSMLAYWYSYEIKVSPNRPDDLTLTRVMKPVGASQEANKSEAEKAPEIRRAEDPDERL
jgi:cell division protein FtsA